MDEIDKTQNEYSYQLIAELGLKVSPEDNDDPNYAGNFVCRHQWQETIEEGERDYSSRIYGDSMGGIISLASICADNDSTGARMLPIPCGNTNLFTIGNFQDTKGREQLPLCPDPSMCRVTPNDCLVGSGAQDPCAGLEFTSKPDAMEPYLISEEEEIHDAVHLSKSLFLS